VSDKISTFFFAALCTVLMSGVIYIAFASRPEITVISGEAVIKYKEFTYRVKGGETFLGVLGDSSLLARIRTANGDIRFEKPLERK
jgi:hypothetical protein